MLTLWTTEIDNRSLKASDSLTQSLCLIDFWLDDDKKNYDVDFITYNCKPL